MHSTWAGCDDFGEIERAAAAAGAALGPSAPCLTAPPCASMAGLVPDPITRTVTLALALVRTLTLNLARLDGRPGQNPNLDPSPSPNQVNSSWGLLGRVRCAS